MENNLSDEELDKQTFKAFRDLQNALIKSITDSKKKSPSFRLKTLLFLINLEYKKTDILDTTIAFAFNLNLYRHYIFLGSKIINFVNKDKINNQVGGKIVCHGKINKDKLYKLTRIKRIYGKDRHMFLFKVNDLTNRDVRAIVSDITNNITFNKSMGFEQPITKADIKMSPATNINIKYINTTTFNGTKYYMYLFKVSINYSNKSAYIYFDNHSSHIKFLFNLISPSKSL